MNPSLCKHTGHLEGPAGLGAALAGQVPLKRREQEKQGEDADRSLLRSRQEAGRSPVVAVPVPFAGRLRPHNVGDPDVDGLMGGEGRHLVGQERLLHHRAVAAAVGMHFPVKRHRHQ